MRGRPKEKHRLWVTFKRLKPVGDERRVAESRWRKETEHGYVDGTLEFVYRRDGALYFSDMNGENFIYLYPWQVKHLKAFLSNRRESEGK